DGSPRWDGIGRAPTSGKGGRSASIARGQWLSSPTCVVSRGRLGDGGGHGTDCRLPVTAFKRRTRAVGGSSREPIPLLLAIQSRCPAASSLRAGGHHPVGINPTRRPSGSASTATAFSAALATSRERPSGVSASAFGALPYGSVAAPRVEKLRITRSVAVSITE